MSDLAWYCKEWAMRKRDAAEDTATRFAMWADGHVGSKTISALWDDYMRRDWISS